MLDVFTEQGELPCGILVDGRYFTRFTLEEEVMRHSLLVSNDTTLDWGRLAGDERKKPPVPPDDAYFSAAIMAARLTVEGIDKVTPEMVEALPKADGRMLLQCSAQLEQRRELFREEAAAAEERRAGAPEAGVPGSGSPGDEPGKD